MDKWRSKAKPQPSIASEHCSLLPPSLRQLNQPQQPARKKQPTSINGFLKRVSAAILDPRTASSATPSSSSSSSCSCSPDHLPSRQTRLRRPLKARSKEARAAGSPNADVQLHLEASSGSDNNDLSARSRSSGDGGDGGDGSLSLVQGAPSRRARRARLQRRRCHCSSLDESGAELVQQLQPSANKRSRASRTERYLKRMCSGKSNVPSRRPHSHSQPTLIVNARRHEDSHEHDITNDNFYARHTQVGVNPLVQRTLQFLSEFDRSTPAQPLQPLHNWPERRYRPAAGNIASQEPPKPPSRDHTSRILVNGASLDKYQRMMRHLPRSPEPLRRHLDKENEHPASSTSSFYEIPNARPANVNRANYSEASPFSDSLNRTARQATSHPIEISRARYVEPASARLSPILPNNPSENRNDAASESATRSASRRSSKNLEEALRELEAIYNSLQLGDEELLDRAERRTMEEFLYKGFTISPDAYDGADPSASRRKTWADPSLDEHEPDRLKDDMAYRRMHPKERPTSVDGQASLSSISYLMTSPIPSRRDMPFVDPRRKSRGNEPDVTLDDVVFRSMHYANNTLKVVEPQPPFGIPLGPITTAADSDYLHTNPGDSDRARSPYVACKDPDVVTDDLAFRNLRKDAQPSSRQSSPSFLPSTPSSPLPHGFRQRRAARSLSANLYGSINKSADPADPADNDDLLSWRTNSTFDDCHRITADSPPAHLEATRTSDSDVIRPDWQRSTWRDLDHVDRHEHKQHHTTRGNLSDPDLSSGSCDQSSDECIRPACRPLPVRADHTDPVHKATSERGSSCLSSVCGTPPPIPTRTRALEPFTEHEVLVYKQLCQDLENLVQLTKATDPDDNPPRLAGGPPAEDLSPTSVPAVENKQNTSPAQSEEKPVSSNSLFIGRECLAKVSLEDVPVISIASEAKADTESASIKRELSSILDSLKSLEEEEEEEESQLDAAKSRADERQSDETRLPVNEVKKVVQDQKCFKEITKEIGELQASPESKERELEAVKQMRREVEDEESENKDKVDENMFLRNVQLAKLSGDWKESTPNSGIVNRRASLVNDDDSRHWEGMNNKCKHKYNSMPAKTSSVLMFRQYGSKRKSKSRKSMCSIS